MSILDLTVLIVSAAVVVLMLFRLDQLHVRTDSFPLIGLHIAFGVGAVHAGSLAWQGRADIQGVCILFAAVCWLLASSAAWRERLRAFLDTFPLGGNAE